ncbi:phage tail tube protein [Saccharopolyspora mangrovi]|uniref:Phage tail tube protein n=1 Tax=Saccharopolyspora mangrovi TaxID=3082379 RepID=A0ABU6A779_9PSEU|nr:phage tail tube protein [Saccharopolyspora sp. S2-29]MEB3367418.1 phage tail tube protein [Saccharopolyspora sp. S2-29]
MAIYSGLSAQIGFAEEVTYGTYVAPTRFYEFLSEDVSKEIERVESEALRAGTRTLRSDRWTPGKINVEGDVELELMTKGAGLMLKHMMGGVATTQPDAVNSPTVYKHTFTPDEVPTGLTCQVGRTSIDGVTRPFSYVGCVISEWEMEAAVDDPVSLTVSLLGRDEDTAQTLATASYPANNKLYTFIHGSLTIDGTPLDVKEFSLSGENGLDDDRYFLGSQLRKKPVQAELLNFEGEVSTEFNNLTLYNKFLQGQEAALVLTFDSGVVIEDALTYKFVITANVRFDGETPTVNGPEVLEQSIAFKCIDSGTGPGSAIKFELFTDEATP